MLELISLKLSNFMSFGNTITEIDLSEKGITYVVGKNLDTNSANGVGKTTILNAICFAFYDKTLKSITKSNVMNKTNVANKACEMLVHLRVKKDNDTYDIIRKQVKGSNSVKIIKNDDPEDSVSTDGIRNDNKFIEENIIGMSFELFKRRVIFSGGDSSFFELEISKQRDIIEELFDITEISEKADKLKAINKILDKNIAIKEAVINEQKIAQATRIKQLEAAVQRISTWDSDRETQLKILSKKIEEYSSVDVSGSEEILLAIAEFEDKQISPLKKDIALSDTKLKSLEKDKSAIVVLLSDLEKNISKKNAEVKHLSGSTCPYCNQHYEQAQEKLEKAKLDLIEYDKEVVALGVSLGGKYIELEAEQKIKDILVGKLAEKDGDYQALLEAKKYIPSIDKLTLIKKELPIAISKYEELSIAVNPHHDALEELENYEEIKIDTKELDDLKDELEHNKFLLKLLTDKNSFIRKKIISKNISKLNQRLGHYLDKFGLPHAVTFTSDMYCEITEYDRTLDYGNLSGGEQKRINLALAFAFGDVGADLSQKINIMFTDEIDGGAICQNGMENIINVLKDKAKEDDIGLWIISHRAEMQNRFPKEMTIVKQHGFASIQ